MNKPRSTFLTAHWRNLVVINFRIKPEILRPLVPLGTELDHFQGEYFVSLVGFLFKKNKFLGIFPTWPVSQFEEVNLRFYVKRTVEGEVRKGVVFIREVVPSAVLAYIARSIYNEPYVSRPMGHAIDENSVSYCWTEKGKPCSLEVQFEPQTLELQENTFAHFILEHYWGYTAQRDGSTLEYFVDHVPWRFQIAKNENINSNLIQFYGERFASTLSQPPHSAFLAEGSAIKVTWPNRFHGLLKIKNAPSAQDVKGWVLYDGACGFCSWWVPKCRKFIRRAGFETAALQTTWVRENLELPEADLANDIRLLLKDGRLINGADAYFYVLKNRWWTSWLAHFLDLPVIRIFVWKFYKIFNANRFLISRTCRLPPEIKE